MAPTSPTTPPAPAAAPTSVVVPEIDRTTNPYVRLEFLQDTIHNFARRRVGEKPDVWFSVDEALKLIGFGTAKIDTTSPTWGEALAANTPRETGAPLDNGPNAARGQARRATDQTNMGSKG